MWSMVYIFVMPDHQPDHTVWHAHTPGIHLVAGVLPNATRWTTTHAADRHTGTGGPSAFVAGADLTEMLRGTEYFSFGGSTVR